MSYYPHLIIWFYKYLTKEFIDSFHLLGPYCQYVIQKSFNASLSKKRKGLLMREFSKYWLDNNPLQKWVYRKIPLVSRQRLQWDPTPQLFPFFGPNPQLFRFNYTNKTIMMCGPQVCLMY